MRKLLLAILIIPIVLFAQSGQNELTFYSDSLNTHGLVMMAKHRPITLASKVQQDIDRINIKTSDKWRLPSPIEMKFIFDKTFNQQRQLSPILNGEDCFTSTKDTDFYGNFSGFEVMVVRYKNIMLTPAVYNVLIQGYVYFLVRSF